jgi:alanine racemase
MHQDSGRAGALLKIDLNALRNNYRLLKSKLGSAACGAAVKADAYGLGALKVSQTLTEEGCRHLFVAHLEEAIVLRPHISDSVAIYVMHGSPAGYEPEFLEYRCIPVLNSAEQILAWRTLAESRQTELPAIIQLDTGMSRMGLSGAEVQAWLADPDFIRGIQLQYLMSHLACAEDQEDPMNAQQLALFNRLRETLPKCGASLANSSGIFLGADFHFDLARPGAALYGIAPVAGQPNPMQAVAHLQGKIIQTREIAAGTGVGYSLTWRSTQPGRIATVAVGYADGWLRALSNRGVVHIDGIKAAMVGNVSMDTITIDVSHVPLSKLVPGTLVDLISSENTVDQIAARAGTIGYEILTSLGHRYHREYSDMAS